MPMEAELKSLVAQRGAIRTKLTLLKKLVESPDEILDVVAFENRVRSNDNLNERFDALQVQIEALVFETPNEEQHIEIREAFEQSYFEVMSAAEKRLVRLRGTPSSTVNAVGSITSMGPDHYPSTRLPVIKLPVFDGDFSQWIRFRDTFISLVHNSSKLSKIDKFNYLVSALTGSAALVLESFSISAENYDLAWSRLKERFDDPRALLTHLIDSLLAMEPLRKSNAKALSEFGDKAVNNVRALESLLRPEELWDALVCIHLSKRLDSASLDEWEKRVMQSDARPTFPELSKFVEQRVIYLTRKDGNKPSMAAAVSERSKPHRPREALNKQYIPSSHTASRSSKCLICNSDHALYHCTKLSSMSFPERHEAVKRARVCFNCLSPGHSISSCTRGNCRKCGQKHHTLLHREDSIVEKAPAPKPLVATTQVASISQSSNSYFSHSANVPAECTVLSTAVVFVVDQKGQKHKCRALLDVGSQAHFISKEFCRKFSLPTTNTETMVGGIGNSRNPIDSRTLLHISSGCGKFTREIDCLVIDRITDEVPNIPLNRVNIPIPRGVRPADPDFQRPGRIDLLIGAGLFWELLCIGQFKVGVGSLMWQKTRLGWVLGGGISFPKSHFGTTVRTCHAVTDTQLEQGLARFWEIEELGSRDIAKINDLDVCERHFNATTTRDSTGRYMVSIPFNDKLKQLGTSREQAERRLISMERKLRRNPDLKQQYVRFMNEYESLGHMTRLAPTATVNADNCFYLPHHAVFKDTSTTTKLRVVFDGSAKTSSGISLNDTQLVGPPLQGDLFNILVRFRKHRIVLSADIEKMYRQVLVEPEHRRYQRILWRSNDSENIAEFSLNTVTYGTASASYLATRTLQEVGRACERSHPDSSAVIRTDFYVDDLLTGCETLQQAIQLRHALTRILDQAGFPLRKWASNEPVVLTQDNVAPGNVEFKAADKDAKTLGLLWSSSSDELGYTNSYRHGPRITKRSILAETAQIFDPLGLVGPVTIRAKLLMQSLWQMGLEWDESLSHELHSQWQDFRDEISTIASLQIPRRAVHNVSHVELHAFSDASEKAYGAVIYLRSHTLNDEWDSRLLCAKSRVAPLKTLSVPRLELCGAFLLAQLVDRVRDALQITGLREFYWTDSATALAWIRGRPCRWHTFVANRVAEIQQLTTVENWGHVSGSQNPADLLSRGSKVSDLQSNKLWWHGPSWLSEEPNGWPSSEPLISAIPEERRNPIVQLSAPIMHTPLTFELTARFSSYKKLVHVLAYCYRFINNARIRNFRVLSGSRGSISASEIERVETLMFKQLQALHFRTEIDQLLLKKPLAKGNRLAALNPFLDEHGLVRVGGRLCNAPIGYNRRHPIILPNSGALMTLIIRREHLRLLHAGPQQTLSSLHARFWIIAGKRVVKKVLRQCITCFRSSPPDFRYQMGNLPAARVTPSRAFSTCGVDYAGPFLIRDSGRGRTSRKAYICLFICLVTKAVHIELAADLSTDAFIKCLHRFISRRGRCNLMYSDNGKNFVGASNELNELGILFSKSNHRNAIMDAAAKERIEWHFIPPYAPHFGGLWERGIRSVKLHIKRVIGEQRLTFEEFSTVLAQIEAVLNSRPLHPMSSDPLDLNPLTPGHFLIGDALTSFPQPDLTAVAQNRLDRYQLLQQMLQHFWKRWRQDYLHELQQRKKWKVASPEVIKVGTMVLVKEENLPPMKWLLGRITELHPGHDGITRVVSLRTANGVYKRPVTKICILPEATQPPDSVA